VARPPTTDKGKAAAEGFGTTMAKARVETQSLTRSCNELLILSALERGPKHGYELAIDIEERGSGMFGFKHGTLYPILHKLEKMKLIRGAWSDEGPRGKRKSYELTGRGHDYLNELRLSWKQFNERLLGVIEGRHS
jgi:DNA-binding PadR family transcriptional regulator